MKIADKIYYYVATDYGKIVYCGSDKQRAIETKNKFRKARMYKLENLETCSDKISLTETVYYLTTDLNGHIDYFGEDKSAAVFNSEKHRDKNETYLVYTILEI